MQADQIKQFEIVRRALNSKDVFGREEVESAVGISERLDRLKAKSSLFSGVELSDALKERLARAMAPAMS